MFLIAIAAVPIQDWSCRMSDETSSETSDPPPSERLRPLALAELLALELKPRGMLLAPIIPEASLTMIYAMRGIGKTHVALGIAHAVATGARFLRWRAPAPRRVLLVDGEMPAQMLRERLEGILMGALPETLSVLSGDLVDGGIGDLAARAVQAELAAALDGIDLLVLDHLSSLTGSLREEHWAPLQQFLIGLRRRGTAVLMVHHAGRAGEPRGTGRREDMLDTSISLIRPVDYLPSEGARFEVHVEKGRGMLGHGARPFEVRLAFADGGARWSTTDLVDVEGTRVATLLNDGLSLREIARETGLSKSAVHRFKQRMVEVVEEDDIAALP
jgi:putative DNA primase/helicase